MFSDTRILTRAEKIMSATMAGQGGTFHPGSGDSVDLTRGFDWVIALKNAELELTPESLETRLARIEAYCSNVLRAEPYAMVGTWIDEDGRLFLDTVLIWTCSKERAMEEGRRQGQRAIWDVKNGTPLYL